MSIRDLFQPNRVINKRTFLLLCLIQAAVAIGVWMFATSPVIPTPMAVGNAWMRLFQDNFMTELCASTALALQALIYTFFISLLISYSTVLPFFRPAGQLVSKMRFLSMVGLSFLFTMMMTGGHNLKLALLVFGMSVFFVTQMTEEIESIPQIKYTLARTLGFSEWRVVWEVVVLGRMSRAFEILRQNFAIAWIMLTMVEGISRAGGGVGTMLLNQNKQMQLDAIFAIQITIFAIGIGIDYAAGVTHKLLFSYCHINVGGGR